MTPPDAPVLQVRGLVKRFGGVPAVDGLDLDVAAGEILAVIGPNGAGKSTLLELVAGTLAPSASRGILLEGRELVGQPAHRIRRLGVATARQDPQPLASLTVGDNVVLGAMFGGPTRESEAAARRLAAEQLELVGLTEQAGWPVDRLTLQQRRRLELARALAGRPRLLLLDEVMAGSNADELDASLAILRRVRDGSGIAIVWVEHVMRAVTQLADRVVVLAAGRVLADGAPAEVMGDERVVTAYLGGGTGHRAAG